MSADLLSLLSQDASTCIVRLVGARELRQSTSTLDCGFELKFHGFNDKLLEHLDIALESFLNFRSSSKKNDDDNDGSDKTSNYD